MPDLSLASKRWPAGGLLAAPAAGATMTIADFEFDDPLAQGDQFTVTFDTPGTHNYFCGIHTSMTGTIE